MIKKQVEPLLINLLAFDSEKGTPIGGILMEKLSLGTKRKLNKIREELLIINEELKRDINEIKETYQGDGAKIQKELEILYNESIVLKSDTALMSEIEKVETEKMYDFDLIELIAK